MTRRWLLATAVVSAACSIEVDYTGTDYQCVDGRTCPDGFACIDQQCAPDRRADAVAVPAGEFVMGCNPDREPCSADARPARVVTLAAFSIDRTEVTRADYARCVADGACAEISELLAPGSGRDPIRLVPWDSARAFCAWAGGRLPTEAEWEKAARGTSGQAHPWGDAAPDCERANYLDCGRDSPIEVGTLTAGASPYGLLEASANVGEWVADWYHADYYQSGPEQDPPGPAAGNERVVRGGNYASSPGALPLHRRGFRPPDDASVRIGFRCAR